VSFTDLLDDFARVGPKLAATFDSSDSSAIRNEINAALLPIWQWLDTLKDVADQNEVDWVLLDGAPSEKAMEAVKGAISILSAESENGNAAALTSELTLLGSLLETVIDETEARLREVGVDAERRNRLLLPLRAHVSELAVTRGSSEALALARQSLGQIGERRLSEGVAEQVAYESQRADRYRYGALVTFVVSICWLIASYVAFRNPGSQSAAWVGPALSRLAIGSAVLVLAVYLSREASQHRTRATGWRSVELQMDTIDLYCASLPPDHRDALRLAFGLQVFSGATLFGMSDQAHASGDGLPTNDCERLVAQVRALNLRT
jgi:hypothetical protein